MKKESPASQIVQGWSPQKIAEELASVQPMPSDTFKKLMEAALPEEKLIEEGYEPVCPTSRLLWRKK